MADIAWVKITTDMFDNRKIKYLRRLPNGDSIVLIWVMLLTMAGRCNDCGLVYITEEIHYTDKTLADELGYKESMLTTALQELKKLGMIDFEKGRLRILNWEEYQNVEGMERIRKQNAKRQADWRERQREAGDNVTDNIVGNDGITLRNVTRNVTNNVTDNATHNAGVTPSNALDQDIEEELDKRKTPLKGESKESPHAPTKKPERHRYGMYSNVLLSDDELDKIRDEFPEDYQDRIERLSEYMAQTGKVYKSHLATIRAWARIDKPKETPNGKYSQYAK